MEQELIIYGKYVDFIKQKSVEENSNAVESNDLWHSRFVEFMKENSLSIYNQ